MRGTAKTGPHPVDRHVGRKVCERRLALGYNQSDLGRALGITFQQVQKYEKGTNRISSSKLWDTAVFLQTDIASFFSDLPSGGAKSGSADDLVPGTTTRATVEIARLAPRLSAGRQKMVLELIRDLVET